MRSADEVYQQSAGSTKMYGSRKPERPDVDLPSFFTNMIGFFEEIRNKTINFKAVWWDVIVAEMLPEGLRNELLFSTLSIFFR